MKDENLRRPRYLRRVNERSKKTDTHLGYEPEYRN